MNIFNIVNEKKQIVLANLTPELLGNDIFNHHHGWTFCSNYNS